MRPQLAALLERIESQRRVVDRLLPLPMRWRGHLRREQLGELAPAERAKVAQTFDWLVREPALEPSSALLCEIHARLGGGGAFRIGPISVRHASGWVDRNPPAAEHVAELVARAFKTADATPERCLAAARLHCELLLIHPFSDGNGRATRLVSSLILMRAGLRSTLLTAVEQHFFRSPGAYNSAVADLVTGTIDGDHWACIALDAMAKNSELISRARSGTLDTEQLDPYARRDLYYQTRRLEEEEAEAVVAS